MFKEDRGVTLIEVLVALGILSIIGIILYSSFGVALRGWKKSDNVTQAAEIARVVLDRITREISCAIVKTGKPCLGYNGPSGSRANSIADEFYFIAPLKTDNLGGSDLCEVGYWVDGCGTAITSDDRLMRFYVTDEISDFDYLFTTGDSRELAANIKDLRFEYYDENGNIFSSWDSTSLNKAPAKIKVTLRVEVGEGSKATNPDFYTGNFSTIIAIPQ